MDKPVAAIGRATARVVLVALTVEIAAVSLLRYVSGTLTPPEPVVANGLAHPFLILHVLAGVTALVLGPLQFVGRMRTAAPRVHRASGAAYLCACAVAGPAGLMLAFGTTAGPLAGLGFAIPAMLLPVFAWRGLHAALRRDFREHREWMLRSYALVSTAVTLRLMLPAAGMLGLAFFPAYRVIAWLAWAVNLAAFEWYIRRTRYSAGRPALLATA